MKKYLFLISFLLCSIIGWGQPKYLGKYRKDIVKENSTMKFSKNEDSVFFCRTETEDVITIYFINTSDRCDCVSFIFKDKESFKVFFNKLKSSYKKPYPSENLWIIDNDVICRVYLEGELPVVYYLTN